MILWVIFSIGSAFASASSVVVQAESTNNFEYQKFLQDQSDKISFIESHHKKIAHNNQLSLILKKAQFEFLKGSLIKSKKEFKNIIELRFKNDWNNEQQKIIHYAFLRLAQLERNKQKRVKILKDALFFNNKIKPNNQLFPPSLINEYATTKAQLNVQIWPLPDNYNLFDQVLINGNSIESASGFLKKEMSTIRISFLSNKWSPQTFVTNTKNLKSLKLQKQPMVTGNCHNPTFHHTELINTSPLIFDKGCVGKTQTLMSSIEPNTKNLTNQSKTQSMSFYKNKWFWIGLSVVAVGLTAYQIDQNNRNGQTPQPPTDTTASEPVVFSN